MELTSLGIASKKINFFGLDSALTRSAHLVANG